MREYITKNDIEKSLERKERELTALITAYENIERKRKKDGADFKVFSKNFSNCNITKDEYSLYTNVYKLIVYTRTIFGEIVDDDINLYKHVDMMTDNEIKHEPAPKEPYLKQIYLFDVDETEQAIKNRIVELEKNLDIVQNQLNNLDDDIEKLDELTKHIKKVVNDTTLGYIAREYIKNNSFQWR